VWQAYWAVTSDGSLNFPDLGLAHGLAFLLVDVLGHRLDLLNGLLQLGGVAAVLVRGLQEGLKMEREMRKETNNDTKRGELLLQEEGRSEERAEWA